MTVSSSTEPLSIFRGITDNVTPPNIFINVSRGTLTTPTTVAAGDEIGGINVKVFDGASFKSVSNILTAVADDAVMSDLNPKSDVYIAAASGGSSFALFEFRGDGTLVVPGNGTASAPSIAFSADASSDTGFFHPGDGIIGVAINAQEKARWNTDGLQVDGAVRVGNTYTTSPDTRPVSPVAGMIIFETTTNSFQGWNGSSWVTLG